MKWSPWVSAAGSGIMKKLHAKVSRLKLQVCCKENVEDRDLLDKMVLLEMKWKGPKAGGVLAPFYRKSTCQRNYTGRRRFLRKGEPIEWDEEFESVCNFSASKDGSFGSWKVSFNILNVSFYLLSKSYCCFRRSNASEFILVMHAYG